MAVRVSEERKAVVLTYDTDLVQGEGITIKAQNTATGDVGSRSEQNNDGEAVLFFPADFTGSDVVVIEGSAGGVDSGEVEIL